MMISRTIAALLSLTDEYVGVSNHEHAFVRGPRQKSARLRAIPTEFRWMHAAATSPWFPGFSLYRQAPSRDWSDALSRLALDLRH
jgi:hypothetical protein